MTDVLLVFPPQWSPCGPPLGLPTLAAWLRRCGFRVSCLDLNLAFYEWLLSDDCAAELISLSAHDEHCVAASQLAVFQSVVRFRADYESMASLRTLDEIDPATLIRRTYRDKVP